MLSNATVWTAQNGGWVHHHCSCCFPFRGRRFLIIIIVFFSGGCRTNRGQRRGQDRSIPVVLPDSSNTQCNLDNRYKARRRRVGRRRLVVIQPCRLRFMLLLHLLLITETQKGSRSFCIKSAPIVVIIIIRIPTTSAFGWRRLRINILAAVIMIIIVPMRVHFQLFALSRSPCRSPDPQKYAAITITIIIPSIVGSLFGKELVLDDAP
mmetsp:Transcript_30056/g.82536  ORF Transcript_30056/g.82536 Transcript_30056/m.82536 type:complete len:208 (-) Transcript_30056:122-745(-)